MTIQIDYCMTNKQPMHAAQCVQMHWCVAKGSCIKYISTGDSTGSAV